MAPTKNELECVSIANEFKRQSLEALLQKRIEEHRKTKGDFARTCRELFAGRNAKRLILFVLLLPFFALLQLVLILLDYLGLLFERRRIGREIGALASATFNAPENKNISALWRACELKEWFPTLSYAAKIECVRRWLPALYGASIARVIRIDLREEEVREIRREARAKHPPRPGVFVTEPDHAEMLIEILSNEMPPYS
jgi:hypothetical protein